MVNPSLPANGPVPTSGSGKPKSSRLNWRRVILVSVIGAAVILAALSVLGWLAKGSNLAGVFGLPSDFPVYPGADLVGVHENFGTNGTVVDASWEVNAPVDEVMAFYSQRLDESPWSLIRANAADGSIEFERSAGQGTGIIELYGHGQQTRVDIQLQK